MPRLALPWSRVRLRAPAWLLPVAAGAILVAWQWDFASDLQAPHPEDSLTASSGLLPDLRDFFYFYWHLGLFPVGAHDVARLGPSRADALDFVARHGDRLSMDFGEVNNSVRYGDYGKLFLFLPDVLLRHDPAHPSAAPFNRVLFVTALIATWWAFWRERRALLGTLIVVLVGSDPFQLYETWGHANVFSLPISVALLALAAHLPYLVGRRGVDRGAWALALVSAVTLATVREIRTEAAVIGVSLALTYLSVRGSWPRRLALLVVFLAAWGATGHAWTTYWSRGFQRSSRFVAQAGGNVYGGPHGFNHAFWHSVYCGLGDFGRDRGFTWEDRDAFRWATSQDPRSNTRPLTYTYREGYYFEETWDGVNHVAPTDVPAYNALVRDRVLGEIRAHPLWYGRILLSRAGVVLGRATPASLSVGVTQLRLPGVGWLLVPILLLAWRRRRAFEVRLILFMLPLSAVALFVYSDRGMTNYGIAHLVALAVAIDLLAALRQREPALVGHAVRSAGVPAGAVLGI